MVIRLCVVLPVLLTVLLGGVGARAAAPEAEVVIYTSVDEPVFAPLLKRFEAETKIKVRVVTDGESTKTAALVERFEAEKDRPRADVYWGNEPFHTINLAEKDLFVPNRPENAKDVPARWRDAGDRWVAVGLRARVLAFSTRPEFKAQTQNLRTLADLGNPTLNNKIGVCNPAFGTASGQFASLYLLLGEEKYTALLQSWKGNHIKLLGGNSVVADQIAEGNLIAGLTDNDDLQNAKHEGQQEDGVFPNQAEGDIGTLLIPTTIALVKNGPHPEAGKVLINFLCDAKVEKAMIDARYLAMSTRGAPAIKAMDVDYQQAAAKMRTAVELALKILQDR